uniref:Uncharacterized protein n=1 Tax=Kalanchoe fedtschenkoi TaxID=63787 RepID=A0A7N0UCY5_KALFE
MQGLILKWRLIKGLEIVLGDLKSLKWVKEQVVVAKQRKALLIEDVLILLLIKELKSFKQDKRRAG